MAKSDQLGIVYEENKDVHLYIFVTDNLVYVQAGKTEQEARINVPIGVDVLVSYKLMDVIQSTIMALESIIENTKDEVKL